MDRYYYAPGMMYPYWVVYEAKDYPKPGESVMIAHNANADTDMGDLYGDEFEQYFPNAFEISKEQYDGRTIDPDDGLAWAYLLHRAKQ